MKLPETTYAAGPEGLVAYQVFGAGPLDLVLIPGWLWNVEVMWEQPLIASYLTRLASFSRVIAFDKRGTGVSDPVPIGALSAIGQWSLPTLEQWTDDVRVVLDAVGSERAAVVGNREGAQMALLFAATHPERTRALVMFDGTACYMRHDDYPAGLPPALLDEAVRVVFGDSGTGGAHEPAADEVFQRWYRRFRRLSVPPSMAEQMFRHAFRWDLRPALPAVQVPTLVLHHVGNAYLRIDHARYVAGAVPQAQLVELPGGDADFFTGDQNASLSAIQEFLTGMRGAPEHDRVLATVLFTDLVGSTSRAAELGDRRWTELLDAHDRLAAEHVQRFRGRVVKTTGDGLLATFDGPARAIRCAARLAGSVRDLGLQIRCGLHTGEVELRGDDIGGLAVALAARVMPEAGPDEVLVSSTVKDLVIGSGIEFADRGERNLRGVPGAWRLYAVQAEADQPPASTSSASTIV